MLVVVEVFEREKAVGGVLQSAYDEASHLVGARQPLERHAYEGGILLRDVGAYEYSLLRLHILSSKHHSGDPQRVERRTGGERICEAREFIALVVVFNGVAEVDGVCGVGEERIGDVDHYPASACGDARSVGSRRGEHHLGECILDVDELVEVYVDVARVDIDRSGGRIGMHEARRILVARTAGGIADRGAPPEHRHTGQGSTQYSDMFLK